jgi:hypothetical protein
MRIWDLTRVVATVAALHVVCSPSTIIAAEGEALPKTAIDEIRDRQLRGMSRDEFYDFLEKQIAERTRQDAERTAREADTRKTLLSIREKIFDIQLRIARIDADKDNCQAQRRQYATLGEDLEALRAFRVSAVAKCTGATDENSSLEAFCRVRTGDIDAEIRELESGRERIRSRCPSVDGTSEGSK